MIVLSLTGVNKSQIASRPRLVEEAGVQAGWGRVQGPQQTGQEDAFGEGARGGLGVGGRGERGMGSRACAWFPLVRLEGVVIAALPVRYCRLAARCVCERCSERCNSE